MSGQAQVPASAEANTPPNIWHQLTRKNVINLRVTFKHAHFGNIKANLPLSPSNGTLLDFGFCSSPRPWRTGPCGSLIKVLRGRPSPACASSCPPLPDAMPFVYISDGDSSKSSARKRAYAAWVTMLDNAIANGTLPVHKPLPPSRAAHIEDQDPPHNVLARMQRELAESNTSRTLLTIVNKTDAGCPSNTTTNFLTYLAPSGFMKLPLDALPVCAHYLNPLRTLAECRMKCRTHKVAATGKTYHYLQVPEENHRCSFIIVLRPRDRVTLFPDTPKRHRAIKDEEDDMPKRKRAIKDEDDTPKRKRAIKDEEDEQRTSGSSNAHAIDLAAEEDLVSPPRSQPQAPHRRRPVGPYTGAEARLNLTGDSAFLSFVGMQQAVYNEKKDASKIFWKLDGPYGRLFIDEDFPARTRPYSSGFDLAKRIALAGQLGPPVVAKFIADLATTDGVSATAFENFMDMLRVCHGCGGHFTPPGFNAHLIGVDDFYHCNNHPSFPIVSCVASVPYGQLLRPAVIPLGRPPGRRVAPYVEFGLVSALGIALSALNTVFGLPDDVFQAVRLGLIPCAQCLRHRTVHAHLEHFVHGVCGDVGPRDSFYIARSASEVTEVRRTSERTTHTITDA
ncbi:hypothetical protein DFH06DRAFT_1338558 [Mycena polygramma]|nr:hypothetical protein DFH06DRAFT_1338558 [Mycena polygramma]